MKKTTFLAVVVFSFLLTSCATIVSGSKQKVSFTSAPAKATVFVNNINLGITPFETKLKRSEKLHKVKIVLEGYKPYETTLTRKFNGWYIGNIAFGGLIGIIVDLSTGAVYRISDSEVNVALENNISMTKTTDGLNVAVVMEVNESLEKIGQLEKTN
jgi:hypothetical protein